MSHDDYIAMRDLIKEQGNPMEVVMDVVIYEEKIETLASFILLETLEIVIIKYLN
jgi:hypothetical protein